MPAEITITLPLPSAKIGPNSRLHWSKKQKITREARGHAKLVTRSILGVPPFPAFTGYRMAFFYPNAIRRDDDNAEAACKAYRDGIASALGIDDHTLPKAAISTFTVDPASPRLEITLLP